MPPRRDPGFTFPPELTQLIQQQNTLMQLLVQNQNQGNNNNNPPPPPPVDHLARFLRLNPPVFSSSTEPIVADDWLRKTARELTTAGCTDAEKVKFAAHQLEGPAASWWENFTATFPVDTITWDQFQQAFQTAHVSARGRNYDLSKHQLLPVPILSIPDDNKELPESHFPHDRGSLLLR